MPLRLIAPLAFASCLLTSAPVLAQQARAISFAPGVPLESRITADDRLVTVEQVGSGPQRATGRRPTVEQEAARLLEMADAIVLMEVQSTSGRLTPRRDWIRTEVRAVVKDFIKLPARPLADGRALTFTFDGGEVRLKNAVVKAGQYPVVHAGSEYLQMFVQDPDALTWYPILTLLVGKTGRLEPPEIFDPFEISFDSPFVGELATSVISKLKKPQ